MPVFDSYIEKPVSAAGKSIRFRNSKGASTEDHIPIAASMRPGSQQMSSMRHLAHVVLPQYDDTFVLKCNTKNVDSLLKGGKGNSINEVKWQVTLRDKLNKRG